MSARWPGFQSFLFAVGLIFPLDLCSGADETVAVAGKPVVASQSVQSALHEIFADQHCSESALSICRRAQQMALTDRYDYLFHLVFPATAPEAVQVPTVRIVIDFTPTDPAPPVAFGSPAVGMQVSTGGQLISPALALVEAAEAIGKLDELLNHLETVPENNVLSQKNRSALIAMAYTRQGQPQKAIEELDRFCKLSAQAQSDDNVFRASELVLSEACRNLPGTAELLLSAIDNLVTRQKKTYASIPWYRQVRSRQSLYSIAGNQEESAAKPADSLWASASAMSQFTRGTGIPASQWVQSSGRTTNAVSHGDDFLYFAIPMTGQFQIECDVSAFGWMETRPCVAAQWVSPVYTQKNFESGNLRVIHPWRPIVPPLTRIADSLHMRSAVADQQITTSANGRIIHQHKLPAHHDPWVALRSGAMQEGWASNVRVTGKPEIPETIEMTATMELESWVPYCDGSVGHHWLPVDGGGMRSIPVSAAVALPDATSGEKASYIDPEYREEAIFYNRPMLEDGTIEYEFFYRNGQMNTHPAIDRLCLLMKPDGVRVHWLTDGKYERTELAPDNEIIEPQQRLLPGTLPLMNEAWNKLRLTLQGDIIELSLNSKPVYRRQLESSNRRRFGFFHFAEQEDLLVRNVRWTGSWPKSLPDLKEQSLAIRETEFLDTNVDHLAVSYRHDFATDALPEEGIAFIQGTLDKNFKVTDLGVVSSIVGPGGYKNATLAPRISVEGDFDITAEYLNFVSRPSLKGSGSLLLVAFLQNQASEEYYVTRRQMLNTPENPQHIVQCVVVSNAGDTSKREYFATKNVEEHSGRLRLSRRGTKMYYLTSEGDSPNFRLMGVHDCAKDPVQMDGIRLVNQIHEVGESQVVWKNLAVRAERLTGPALGATDVRLVKLNKERDELPIHVKYDFQSKAPSETALYRWGDKRPWNRNLQGLLIQSTGTSNWTSSGIKTQQPIVGDFDVRVEFDNIQLKTPQKGQGTGVFMQVDFTDEKKTQISAIFNLTDTGIYEFDSQMRINDASGKPTYRNTGRRNTSSASSLRIARRGTQITVISQARPDADDLIVAEFAANDTAVADVKVHVHTGGPIGDSQVTFKAMDIKASFYQPLLIEP
ncbi:MAG: DUF1583 domain-containing protein [Planctomycetaceae bacterium]